MQPITATTWGLCSSPSHSWPTWSFYGFRPWVFVPWEFLQISISLTLIPGSAPLCVPGESAASANAVSPSTAAVNLRCPPSHPSPSQPPLLSLNLAISCTSLQCNCLTAFTCYYYTQLSAIDRSVGSLFSCQSGCNRWPRTFLNTLHTWSQPKRKIIFPADPGFMKRN